MLAAVALAGLRPWEDDSVAPHLSVSGGVGGTGDAVAVAPGRSLGPTLTEALGRGHAAPPAKHELVTGGSGFTLAVAQGRPVNVVAAPFPPLPTPNLESPSSPEPAPAPAPPPPPQTIVTSDGNGAGGPNTAVVVEPQPGCEGDEYEITIRFATSAIASDEAEVEILIRRAGRDGSESEIELQGQFDELGALLDQVTAEADCVDVRIEPASEEEPAGESPEAPVATTSLEEELEPVLP